MNHKISRPRKPKVAWILTHRIQYFVNLIDTLHKRQNVEVALFLGCAAGLIDDKEFGTKVIWDNRTDTSFPEIFLQSAGSTREGFLKSYSANLGVELDKWQPDYLYINGYMDAISWQAFAWARRNKKPYSIRCDGDNLAARPPLKAFIRRVIAGYITKRAHKATYQGRENKAYWEELGATRDSLLWVPCVPDSEVYRREIFRSEEDRQAFRAGLGAGPDDVVAVVNGKLTDRKRPMDALEALGRLKRSPMKLWFLGSGVLQADLEARSKALGISDRVNFLGFKNQSAIPEVLRASDFLLHPSSRDPWPYSILEAAICGNALALSNLTGSYPDWMAPPRAGVSFNCADIDSLVDSIRPFLESPAFLRECSENALSRSGEYTEEVFCTIFEKMMFEKLA